MNDIKTAPDTDRDTLVRVATEAVLVMADRTEGCRGELGRLIHPTASNHESVTEPPAARGQGPDAFYATARWLQAAFSDLAFAVRHVAVDADLVVLHVTMSGRHTGEFVTYAADGAVERVFVPTGQSFEVTQTHWQRIVDGKVIEHWANRDDQGMAAQAGWVPPSPLFLLRCGRATSRVRRQAGRA